MKQQPAAARLQTVSTVKRQSIAVTTRWAKGARCKCRARIGAQTCSYHKESDNPMAREALSADDRVYWTNH